MALKLLSLWEEMEIVEIRHAGEVPVVQLKGKITLGQDCTKLREMADQFFERRQNRILLNLAEVAYVDSAGLGAIAGCYVKARASGGSLSLCNVPAPVEQLLTLTRLNEKIPIYADETAALALI